MLLQITGDATVVAQIASSKQEPLLVVDPMLPFVHPGISSKFAVLLGFDATLSFDEMGIAVYTGTNVDPKTSRVNLNLTPEQAGMQTGTTLYLTRELIKPPPTPVVTAFPIPLADGLATPAKPQVVTSSVSPDSRYIAPVRQTPAGYDHAHPQDNTPKSAPWDISSQMEEAAAKRRAQQIMEDFMRNKNRVSSLEDELSRVKLVAEEATAKLQEAERKITEMSPNAQSELDELKRQNYDLKKDMLELRKANSLFDRSERERALEIESLQLGVEAAEERGRSEVDKKLHAATEELQEARTFIDALKERLIAQAADLKRLQDPSKVTQQSHTEHIILPPGMLRKLVTVNGQGIQYFRDKYGVQISLMENTMTVEGDPVHIQLLKNECQEHLGLADPSKDSVASVQEQQQKEFRDSLQAEYAAKETELSKQIEQLTSQYAASQHTIESLHVALKHAQNRIDTDLHSTKELRDLQSKEAKRQEEEVNLLRQKTKELNAELGAKSCALEDANKALTSTIDTFQLEFERAKDSKGESAMLRSLLEKKDDELKKVTQDLFVTREQLTSVNKVSCDLQGELDAMHLRENMVPSLETALQQARMETEKNRNEVVLRSEGWGAEKGMLLEKNQRLQEALDSAVGQLEAGRRLRDELSLSRIREEELLSQIRALQAAPEVVRNDDAEREAIRLREDVARQARETADLNATIQERHKQQQVLLAENEALKRDYVVAVDNTARAESKVADLRLRLEESRLTGSAVAAAASPLSEGMRAVDSLRNELREASFKPLAATPVAPSTETTALVDAIRMELEAKKAQLNKSNLLTVSPRRHTHTNAWDLSPAKPISPSSTHVSPKKRVTVRTG